MVWLPLAELNRYQIDNIKQELTIFPRKTTDIQTKEDPQPIFLFEEDEEQGLLGIPRYYYLERRGANHDEVLDISYGKPMQDLRTNFAAEGPYVEQADALEELEVALDGRKWGGVLLQAPPGSGKTIMALEFARRIGRRTLVLVHKDFLVQQWKKRIGWLMPDARVGIIKQSKCEFDELEINGNPPDFVIALLQSLSRDDGFKYPDSMYSAFGTIISDESLPYEAQILTEDGPRSIGDLVADDRPLRVVAYDREVGQFSLRNVTRRWVHPPRCNMVEVMHERGSFRCTENHVVVTSLGDVQAKNLVPGVDFVVCYKHIYSKQNVQTRVLSVTPVSTPGLVYDLSVDGLHNFVADGVVVHNCHRVGAGSWSGIIPRFKAAWRLGCTATPRRKDGAQDVFFKHISPITYSVHTKMMRPKLRKVITTSTLRRISRGKYQVSIDNLNSGQIINQLADDKFRTRHIVDDMIKAVVAGRKIMVVSERLEHLKAMAEQLGGILFGMDLPFTPRIDFYTGQWFTGDVWTDTKRGNRGNILHRKGELKLKNRTSAELEHAESANVIFATKQICEEGLDVPSIDVLVMATPISDVEQIVGRIQRWCFPQEGKCEVACPWRAGKCKQKPQPIVVDVVDELITQLNPKYRRRMRFYKKLGTI